MIALPSVAVNFVHYQNVRPLTLANSNGSGNTACERQAVYATYCFNKSKTIAIAISISCSSSPTKKSFAIKSHVVSSVLLSFILFVLIYILVAKFAFIIYITCSLSLFLLRLALPRCIFLCVYVCVCIFKYAHWHLTLWRLQGQILGPFMTIKNMHLNISCELACVCV